MSEPRRPTRPRKANPSPAALGVVKVDADFEEEFPDGDASSAEVFATLVRSGAALTLEIDRSMATTFDLPPIMANCLAVVEGVDQPLTPTEISERTLVSSATMTGTLDQLEYRGWVRRLPNPADRRSVLIEITPEGRAAADQILPGIRKIEVAVLGGLSPTERATLLKLLGKVLDRAATVARGEPIELNGRRARRARPH